MPLYNFDPGEEGEDDWETELLDENFDSRQKRVSGVDEFSRVIVVQWVID